VLIALVSCTTGIVKFQSRNIEVTPPPTAPNNVLLLSINTTTPLTGGKLLGKLMFFCQTHSDVLTLEGISSKIRVSLYSTYFVELTRSNNVGLSLLRVKGCTFRDLTRMARPFSEPLLTMKASLLTGIFILSDEFLAESQKDRKEA